MRQRFDALFFGAFADEEKKNVGLGMLECSGSVEESLEAMGVAHRADVADQEFAFSIQLAAYGLVGHVRLRLEKIGFDSVFNDGDFFFGDAPVFDEMFAKSGRDYYDAVCFLIKKSGDFGERVMQQRIFVADSDGDERLRPEVADFEDEGNLSRESEPPSSKADEQLRRSGDDDVGAWDGHAAQRC